MIMKWYAVRCCCTPKKIFGFILLPEGTRRHTVPLTTLGPSSTGLLTVSDPGAFVTLEKAEIEVRPIGTMDCGGERLSEEAVYSNDRPIEFWRTVRGFVEAKE